VASGSWQTSWYHCCDEIVLGLEWMILIEVSDDPEYHFMNSDF
jgi:hypothetical protein